MRTQDISLGYGRLTTLKKEPDPELPGQKISDIAAVSFAGANLAAAWGNERRHFEAASHTVALPLQTVP